MGVFGNLWGKGKPVSVDRFGLFIANLTILIIIIVLIASDETKATGIFLLLAWGVQVAIVTWRYRCKGYDSGTCTGDVYNSNWYTKDRVKQLGEMWSDRKTKSAPDYK